MSQESAKTVDMRKLKETASELPEAHPLRILLESEENVIPAADFIVKVPIWLRLARLQRR